MRQDWETDCFDFLAGDQDDYIYKGCPVTWQRDYWV